MIGKLFARIRRIWPLVTRARLNRVMAVRDKVYAMKDRRAAGQTARAEKAETEAEHARGQCDRAKQEAEENRRHATAMQLRLTELMRAYRTASGSVDFNWELLATSIIHQTKDDRTRHIAVFYGKPELKRTPYIHNAHTYTEQPVEMHRFGIEIGMSPDTPPELVAGQIADHVRAFILENWRTQSLLLAKE